MAKVFSEQRTHVCVFWFRAFGVCGRVCFSAPAVVAVAAHVARRSILNSYTTAAARGARSTQRRHFAVDGGGAVHAFSGLNYGTVRELDARRWMVVSNSQKMGTSSSLFRPHRPCVIGLSIMRSVKGLDVGRRAI